MKKSRIPVTVTNVACELFYEVYNQSIKGLYNIKYDCFENSQNNYSAYIWAKQTDCDQPAEIDCLVGTLYRTYEPCNRVATTLTCSISITVNGNSPCNIISLTTTVL